MNGKDLLDIMEQVDDDLILESEAAPVVKKHQRWIAPAAGIAATVIALAGIVFLIKLTGSKETENTYMTTGPDITTTTEITTTPSEITTTPPDMTTAIPGWIKYCPDDSGMIHDTREVPAGEIEMPAVLKDEIGNPENSHQCFAVQIEISNLRYGQGEYPEDMDEEIRMEIERLRALGYDLNLIPDEEPGEEKRGFCVTGVLTGSDLCFFRGNPDYGYRISWLSV